MSRTLLFVLLALPGLAGAAVTCSVTATGPTFGIYNPLAGAPLLANGQVTASCTLTGTTSTTVSLVSSYSIGSGASYATRSMVSGTSRLNYNLYYDAAFSQIRGDGTGGSQTGGATFNLTRTNPTQSTNAVIYGRIPAGQDVAPGSYLDTIVVTVTY
jgi:spore coat protein U-like protein